MKGDMPMATTVVFGVLVVIGACLAAVAGLELVQRLVPAQKRQEHNDVAGFLYAVLGVVYAVLLALLVIAVWEQFQKANETVESEANGVAEVAWLAHRLPEPERHELQEDARAYAQEVVDTEWPRMEQGIEGVQSLPEGWDLIDDMRETLQDFEPSTAAEQELYPEGHTRSSVGRAGVWGGGGSRLHLPLWLAEQLGAQADGDVANGSDRAGTIRNRCHGASLLWGC